MVAFYKRDIMAWRDGTRDMTSVQRDVYSAIFEEIYLRERSVRVNPKFVAGLCNISTRLANVTIEQLIYMGKLERDATGLISNGRALLELGSIEKNRRNSAKGGRISGEARRTIAEASKNISKNNGEHEASLQTLRSLKDKTRLKKKDSCSSDDERFHEFWAMYPKRVAKKDAIKAYRAALKETSPAAILKALTEQIPKWTEVKFIPYPASWLRDGRWEDEAQASQPMLADWQEAAGFAPSSMPNRKAATG